MPKIKTLSISHGPTTSSNLSASEDLPNVELQTITYKNKDSIITDKKQQDGCNNIRNNSNLEDNSNETGFKNGTKTKSEVHYLDIKDIRSRVKVRVGRWWQGLCFGEKVDKIILQNVNMRIQSGEVTAILGNSGSGKTTLLDIIASRTTGEKTGSVQYCDEELTSLEFRKLAGYVIQADHHLANLTVEETLTYVAQLKFLGNQNVDIKSRVSLAISQMGMRHLSNSIIGGVVERGLSGGEKRRLSIATQLIQDPALLLLDEPTTGLDSFTAHSIISTLSNLAKNYNKIVLLSIHQPRSDIFSLFDKVGILTMGEIIYYGPRGKIVHYFTEAGYPCPTYANPLDHYVDVCSIDRRSEQDELLTLEKTQQLKENFKKSFLYLNMLESMEKEHSRDTKSSLIQSMKNTESCCLIKYLKQTTVLLKRLNVNISRSRISIIGRLTQITFFAFVIWIFLFELTNDYTGIQDRTGLMFETVSATPIFGLLNAIAMFPTLRDLYYRELEDGLYKAPPFLTAYYIHILPFHVISSAIFASWVYWGVGCYPDVGRFFIFMAVVIMLQYIGELIAVMFLCIFDQISLAQSVTMLYFSVAVMAASGLLRSMNSLPDFIYWFQYTTFYKYASEIVIANEYHSLTLDCSGQTGSSENCTLQGDDYLAVFFPDAYEHVTQNLIILVSFIVGLWILNGIVYKIKGVKHFSY